MKSAAQTAASQGTLGMNSMRTFAFEFGLAGQPELESGLAHRLLRRLPTDPSRHRGGVRNAAVALLASAERSCSASGSKPQASPAEQKAPGTVLLRAFYFFRGFEKMALNTVSAGLASPPTLSGVLSLVFLHLLPLEEAHRRSFGSSWNKRTPCSQLLSMFVVQWLFLAAEHSRTQMFELLLHAAHAHVLAAPAASLTEHSGHATMAGQKNVPTHQLNLVGGTNEVYNRCATRGTQTQRCVKVAGQR
jgi:hypothetical protein